MNSVHRVSLPSCAADDDVGDVAVDHVVGIEHQRADRAALCELLQGVRVRFVRCQQRKLGQRRSEQRSGHQTLAELLDDHGGVGQFAARTTQFLGNDERGSPDLLAQQRPQLLVVTEVGFEGAPHRLRPRVLLDERRDGIA